MFVNCDRQLGRAQVVVRAQVSDGCAGRGKAEFRDPLWAISEPRPLS